MFTWLNELTGFARAVIFGAAIGRLHRMPRMSVVPPEIVTVPPSRAVTVVGVGLIGSLGNLKTALQSTFNTVGTTMVTAN